MPSYESAQQNPEASSFVTLRLCQVAFLISDFFWFSAFRGWSREQKPGRRWKHFYPECHHLKMHVCLPTPCLRVGDQPLNKCSFPTMKGYKTGRQVPGYALPSWGNLWSRWWRRWPWDPSSLTWYRYGLGILICKEIQGKGRKNYIIAFPSSDDATTYMKYQVGNLEICTAGGQTVEISYGLGWFGQRDWCVFNWKIPKKIWTKTLHNLS